MKTSLKVRVIAIFLWVGFVCAISFMEAWIKFTATGVTLSTGLAIGQVVFGALNRVEITLATVIMATLVLSLDRLSWQIALPLVAMGILSIQTVVLLPEMSSRIDIYLAGETPPGTSSLHRWYVAGELLKVIALSISGFQFLPTETKYNETKSMNNVVQSWRQ